MKFLITGFLRRVMYVAMVLMLSGSFYASAQVPRTHQYRITIDNALRLAEVNICFAGNPPEYLMVDYRKATENIRRFPKVEKGIIEYQGRYWKTKFLGKDSCLNYQVDISEHLRKANRPSSEKSPLSFQTENTWLWLPEKLADDEQVDIQFILPQDYRVSAPWQMLDKTGRQFRIGRTPHDWGFSLLIGDFQLQTVSLSGGGQLNIALLDKVEQKAALTRWVRDIGQTLGNYLGQFPYPQIQVILIENRRFASGPVPWGDVKRGGGFGIRFVVDSEKPLSEFYDDWTATHEFSHLLVPNLVYQDSWMSEGLASYLQFVLMARGNQISQQEAWQRLYLGFNRGLEGTRKSPREKLQQTVDNRQRGDRSGRTMRIYWSGAIYFMTADVRLRQQTDGRMGLQQLLLQLNQCCKDSQKEWHGIELANRLDQLSGTTIFSSLYREYSDSTSFPEFNDTLQQLGIDVDNGQVVLREDNTALRNQIMASTKVNSQFATQEH